jgi:hypothetical protein
MEVVETGSQTPPEGSGPPPWWSRSELRLTVLLSLLGGVAILWLLTSAGELRGSAGGGGGHRVAVDRLWCVPGDLPQPVAIDRAELRELYLGLSAVVPRPAAARQAEGVAAAEDMWSDDAPQTQNDETVGGRWPGAYEIRAPTRHYTVVADGLVFASARVARAFFAMAASTLCRSKAQSEPVSYLSGARNLAWINPDEAEQNDVFLLRGARVYRVGDVRNLGTERLSLPAEAAIVDRFACRLPEAGCSLRRQ